MKTAQVKLIKFVTLFTLVGPCIVIYKVIQNYGRGFNNLSYTIHLREQYVVAPMDQENLKVFFYDVWCVL